MQKKRLAVIAFLAQNLLVEHYQVGLQLMGLVRKPRRHGLPAGS